MEWNEYVQNRFLLACWSGNRKKIAQAIQDGAIVDGVQGNYSWNSVDGGLHQAAQVGRVDVANFLLDEFGANIEAPSKNGHSPLAIAASSQHLKVAHLLISRGADPDSPGSTLNPLHTATQRSNLKMMKLLLDSGADPNVFARNWHPKVTYACAPLHLAAWNKQEKVVEMLLRAGADPGLTCGGESAAQLIEEFGMGGVIARIMGEAASEGEIMLV